MAANERERILVECATTMGFEQLRSEQARAIMEVLEHKDVFVVLPTGYGKSLCYAILPLVFDKLYKKKGSIAMVVSPLISLMKDQVNEFVSLGLTAVRIGDCSTEVNCKILAGRMQCRRGKRERIIAS